MQVGTADPLPPGPNPPIKSLLLPLSHPTLFSHPYTVCSGSCCSLHWHRWECSGTSAATHRYLSLRTIPPRTYFPTYCPHCNAIPPSPCCCIGFTCSGRLPSLCQHGQEVSGSDASEPCVQNTKHFIAFVFCYKQNTLQHLCYSICVHQQNSTYIGPHQDWAHK